MRCAATASRCLETQGGANSGAADLARPPAKAARRTDAGTAGDCAKNKLRREISALEVEFRGNKCGRCLNHDVEVSKKGRQGDAKV